MTNFMRAKDITISTFDKFIQTLKKLQNISKSVQYNPIVVWGDIAGNRIYFTHENIRYFWVFEKYTLIKIAEKLHAADITIFEVDTSCMAYVISGEKRIYKNAKL